MGSTTHRNQVYVYDSNDMYDNSLAVGETGRFRRSCNYISVLLIHNDMCFEESTPVQASDRSTTGETQDHEHPESDPQAARAVSTAQGRQGFGIHVAGVSIPGHRVQQRCQILRRPSGGGRPFGHYTGHFEPEFFRVASPFLADGGVFFDVGANVGLCSFGMIAALGETGRRVQFHLFEANPALCPCLTKSAELHPDVDVRIKHACVTDMSGWSRLAVKADSGKSFVTDGEGIAVENLTLDDYVDAHSVPHVDLMKLDVEGYEGRVLRGMERQLSRGVVEAIYVEMISEHLSRAGTSASEVLRLLIDCGLTPYHCKDEDFSREHRNSFEIPPGRKMTMTVHGRSLAVRACGHGRGIRGPILHRHPGGPSREQRRTSGGRLIARCSAASRRRRARRAETRSRVAGRGDSDGDAPLTSPTSPATGSAPTTCLVRSASMAAALGPCRSELGEY